jgi:hypothetical protein
MNPIINFEHFFENNDGITVLSLFDGMSCGQIALNRLGIKVKTYYASEIEKHPMFVTNNNFPNTIQLGDVTKIQATDLPKIDLLIGGSPCQGFSFAGKQLAFNDPRSKLFFEFVRLKNELNPTYWMLENVYMKKESIDVISDIAAYHLAILKNDKTLLSQYAAMDDRLYKDLALITSAKIALDENNTKRAKEYLSRVPMESQLKEFANSIEHFTIKGIQ